MLVIHANMILKALISIIVFIGVFGDNHTTGESGKSKDNDKDELEKTDEIDNESDSENK